MFRRVLSVVTVLAMASVVFVAASPAQAAETVIDGMHFTVDPGNVPAGASLVRYDGSAKTLAIPEKVAKDGVEYIVKTIAERALYQKGLTAVTIPSGVVHIADEALRGNALTSVDLPDGLQTIGKAAFGVNALTSIDIPSTVTSLDTGVFGINKIKTLVIPPNVTSLPSKAFISNELTSVTFPDTMTHIGGEAFRLNHLKSIDIPAGLSEIESDTFSQNDLTSVTVPGNVKKIGTGAFSGNPLLTTVKIADGVEEIGKFAFAQLLTGPRDNPEIIPCNITSVDLGNVERIRYGAFQDCKVASLSIPDSTTLIELEAFAHNRLTSVDFGNGLQQLGPLAFEENLLTNVTLPASITIMGSGVFASNTSLTSVAFLGSVPAYDGSPLLNPFRDDVTKLRVDYYWRHSAAAGVAGGFTSPKWLQYTSRAIALVSFDRHGHGDQYAASEVSVGEKAYEPQEPTSPGWTFGGWFTDDTFATPFDFNTSITRDVTLHAKWTQQSNAVRFDLNGQGDSIAGQSIPYGEKIAAPTPPSETGWTFGGWFTDEALLNAYDFDAPVTGNLVLWAKWTQQTRAISYDLNSHGDQISASEVPYGGTAIAPVPDVPAGWTFEGWFTDDTFATPFDFDSPVTEDAVAHAKWTQQTREVSFDMNGQGDQIPAGDVLYGATAPVPAAPGRVGWTFGGWFTDETLSTEYDFDAPVTHDLVLHAKWTQQTREISYDVNGHGDQVDADDVLYGQTISAPVPGAPTGWTFLGWFTDDSFATPFDFASPVTEDVVAHAKWSAQTEMSVDIEADTIAAEGRDFTLHALVGPVDSAAGVPVGFVDFFIDGAVVGLPVLLDGDGSAIVTVPGTDAGPHTVRAVFRPADDRWDASSNDTDLTVLTTQAAVSSIEMSADPLKVKQGSSTTMSVTAVDTHGDPLGDVTGLTTFTSSMRSDQVDGSTIKFPHASKHTITGTLGDATDQVSITVIPRAVPVASSDAALPDTGGPSAPLLLVTGLLLCCAGALVVRRAS